MRVQDFSFRRDETRASSTVFPEGITKIRQSGLPQKSWLQLPKMLETQSERFPVKLSQKLVIVGVEKSGSFYLQPTANP